MEGSTAISLGQLGPNGSRFNLDAVRVEKSVFAGAAPSAPQAGVGHLIAKNLGKERDAHFIIGELGWIDCSESRKK
jgi:hypothetical protein